MIDKYHDNHEEVTAVTPMTAKTEETDTPKKAGALALVQEYLVDTFTDERGVPYATIAGNDNQPTRTIPVNSRAMKLLVREKYYRQEGRGLDDRVLDDALNTLAAICIFDGKRKPVTIRTAQTENGAVEVDLGSADGKCVHVSPEGYSVREPSARFFRPDGFGEIVFDRNAPFEFQRLWDHVNITDPLDQVLVAGWMVSALRGSGPYPLLVIQGEQGSAKSTTTKMIRSLVDPGRGDGRGLPKTVDDLFITAQNGHVMAFDNLSGMTHEMSDAFCRISTGGAYAKRKLYTTDEESVLEACKPVIFNGIDDLISRPDLYSRAVVIHLSRIPDEDRKDETELWKAFEADRGTIFNGLLKGLRSGLRHYDEVELPYKPRMADFARFATAAEKGLGLENGITLKAITQRQEEANLNSLELDPVAPRIIDWFKPREGQPIRPDLEGTATEIWEQLTPMSDKPSNWPKTASHFSQHLSRITPLLATANIVVERPPRQSGRKSIVISLWDFED